MVLDRKIKNREADNELLLDRLEGIKISFLFTYLGSGLLILLGVFTYARLPVLGSLTVSLGAWLAVISVFFWLEKSTIGIYYKMNCQYEDNLIIWNDVANYLDGMDEKLEKINKNQKKKGSKK